MASKVATDAARVTACLGDLAAACGDALVSLDGDPQTPVTYLVYDWRWVPEGSMFCCLDTVFDGHRLAARAVETGARSLCVEYPTGVGVPELLVSDVRLALARMAAAFYGRPAEGLTLLGVTGTNGKTTTTLLLESILKADGRQTGLIGSMWWRVGDRESPSAWTTPEAPVLHWLLADMRSRGVDSVAMEVTSHGLRLKRVEGLRFASSVFTNLTHDHLDFHSGMEDYFEAKRSLFLPERTERAAVNVDDPYGRKLASSASVSCLGFGTTAAADVRAERVRLWPTGSTFDLVTPEDKVEFSTALVGMFNVYNCLAAAAGSLQAGIPLEAVLAGLSRVHGVPGRFERIDLGQPFSVVVDYAHAPDSLETVLGTARELVGPHSRLICVFGCGGDCDRTKRTVMGGLAGRLADVVVVTSDNPRFEDPALIIAEVLEGLLRERVTDDDAVVPDRREAIGHALGLARPGDVVLIAGKGAEQSQAVRGRKLPLDDRKVARVALQELGWRREGEAASG